MDVEDDDFSHHDATPKQQDAPCGLARPECLSPLFGRIEHCILPICVLGSMPASTAGFPPPTDVAPDVAPHHMGRRLQRMLRPIADYVRLVTESSV